MNNHIREHELLVLLCVLFLTQLLIPGSPAPVDYASNAAWLSMLLALVSGVVFSCLLVRFCGQTDYFSACDRMGRLSFLFTGLLGLLFFVLTVISFRGLLDTLEACILPLTPRGLAAGLLLLCLLPGCFLGSAPVSRMLAFYSPFALALFFFVLLITLPGNGDVKNLFPLLGNGIPGIAIGGGIGALSYLWLFILLIEHRQTKQLYRTAVLSVCLGTLPIILGYLCFSLINTPGSSTEAGYPLHQIASLSGYWRFFQRTQSLFVFAWLPLLLCAGAAGLGYAGRCLGQALHMQDPRPLFLPLGILLLCLSSIRTERMPEWLLFVLDQKAWCALPLLPLLFPPLSAAVRQRKARRQNSV